MSELTEYIFSPLELKRTTLPNRLVRSATYEGMADANGYPQSDLTELYLKLTADEPLTIITGFCAVSRQGRAMHPYQAAMSSDSYIAPWQKLTAAVKRQSPNSRLFMQLAHTGRQTRANVTGHAAVGASAKRCTYFRQKVRPLTDLEIDGVIGEFANAAFRAKAAGFHGVQLHAAHGYLIHQFLSPRTNNRQDRWGEPTRFLKAVVQAVQKACGDDFPLLLKVSHTDDYGLDTKVVIQALKAVEAELDAVEVSYGTMEHALNIIRGDCPIDVALRVNPLFKNIPGFMQSLWKTFCFPRMAKTHIPFTPLYNLNGALAIKRALSIPVIPVGGIQSLNDMETCRAHGFKALALCRPLIYEPDLAAKLRRNTWKISGCTRCNLCTVNCDGPNAVKCYMKGTHHD